VRTSLKTIDNTQIAAQTQTHTHYITLDQSNKILMLKSHVKGKMTNKRMVKLSILFIQIITKPTITYEQNIIFTQAHKQYTTTKNYTKGKQK